MAQSARTSALLANRKYYSSEKRKVLSPNALGSTASSIGRKTITAEMDSQISRYNDGLIGNDEFLAYLKKIQGNGLLTPTEKVDIEDKVRDFTKKIVADDLQAKYKNASGYDKVNAAKALASYYQQEAGSMESGTPAQSQALGLASDWKSKADTEEQSILVDNRKLLRAQKFYEIAGGDQSSVQAYYNKADAYDQLAQAAYTDGDQTEGLRYATQAENTRAQVPAVQERLDKQGVAANRAERVDMFRQIQVAYQNGEINVTQAAQAANTLNDQAFAEGDYSFQLEMQDFAKRLNTDQTKGTSIGELEGLKFITRGTNGGTASIKEMRKVFSREDDDYRTAKREISAMPDAVARYSALVKLEAAYAYGIKPDSNFPDGFEGLANRKVFWDQLSQQYPEKSYDNNVRDTQEKLDVLETELGHNVVTLEGIAPGISQETAQGILGDILSAPPEGLGQEQPGSLQKGIMVSYDKYGNKFEKVINLNQEYTDPTTGEMIKTKIGQDIGMIKDENGQNRWVQLTPYYAPGDNQYPAFAYANVKGQFLIPDINTGVMTPAKDLAATNTYVSDWYQQHAQEETWKPTVSTPEPSNLAQPRAPKAPEIPSIPSLVPGQPATPQVVIPAGTQFTPEGQKQVIRAAEPIAPQPLNMGQLQQQNQQAEKLVAPQAAAPSPFTMAGVSPININLGQPIDTGLGIPKVTQTTQQPQGLMQQLQPTLTKVGSALSNAYQQGKQTLSNVLNKIKFW